MERLQRMFAGAGGALGHPPPDSPTLDSSEQVYISSLALLKMLKHGRAGVPMEVMGLMLGEFVDEYTVRVVDVFAMPQSGTGVSVEAVDHVFQTNMLDMLKQTGSYHVLRTLTNRAICVSHVHVFVAGLSVMDILSLCSFKHNMLLIWPEMVVGWYHSHPGFGCWLSGVDINTQQSVKGKVVIDAFRLINPQTMMLGQEPRQTTSNLGHLNKPSIQALIHGLNRHYYSIAINYRKNELEEKMLLNLHKKKWTDGLTLQRFDTHSKTNEQTIQEMLNLAVKYNKAVQEEDELPPEKLAIANVGRQDAKKHLEEHVSNLMSSNIIQTLGTMLDTVVF
ncbi:JAB1/MPN/MOV34 metalloenzyme domain [Dillenia turbinata]|uniref:JAB1/MPN/MOV34 metalloenzyme domain n=1 Tax=Dillenia turbinata TaxID=194707 RepID=A0AAN8VR62_9MAGN